MAKQELHAVLPLGRVAFLQAVKNDGQTALHEAAEAGQKEAVQYLLSVGANAQAQDEVRPGHFYL